MKNPFNGTTGPITKLHPLDEADWYRKAILKWGDAQKVATMVGVSVSHVYQRLRLLTLHREIQEALRSGTLKAKHAFALAEAGAGPEFIPIAQQQSVRALRKQLRAR